MNDTSNELQNLKQRVEELETRVAFQDDLVHTLSEQLSHQQLALSELWDAKRLLQDQLKQNAQGGIDINADEPPPPHY